MLAAMCRNIKTLHNFEPAATEDEIRAAALQFVRKVSGSAKPSRANEAAYEQAVDEIAAATSRLLTALVTSAPPRDREVEAAIDRLVYFAGWTDKYSQIFGSVNPVACRHKLSTSGLSGSPALTQ